MCGGGSGGPGLSRVGDVGGITTVAGVGTVGTVDVTLGVGEGFTMVAAVGTVGEGLTMVAGVGTVPRGRDSDGDAGVSSSWCDTASEGVGATLGAGDAGKEGLALGVTCSSSLGTSEKYSCESKSSGNSLQFLSVISVTGSWGRLLGDGDFLLVRPWLGVTVAE